MTKVKVKVKVSKWGNYKKGDELEMHPTTAKACSKYVELVTDKPKRGKKVDADNN